MKVGASIGVLVWLVTWLGEAKLEEYVTGSGLTGELVILSLLRNERNLVTRSTFQLRFHSTHSFLDLCAGTLLIIPSTLLLVTFHPQPAENCPCFEDAIAFLSVFAGILLGLAWNPYKYADNTLGFHWRDVTEVGIWTTAVGSKLIIGKFPTSSNNPLLKLMYD